MVSNKLLTMCISLLFLLVIFSTGCDDKKEGNNTSDNKTKEENETGVIPPRDDVSGGIKVQHMEGYANQTGSSITDIKVYIALHSGTDAVDVINDLFIHFTWIDNEDEGAIGGAADLVEANNTEAESHNANKFWAESIADPHGSFQNSGVLDQDSLVVISISTWELQQPPANADLGDDNGLDASSSGTLKFIISEMTPTIKGFNVPGSFPPDGGWVEMY